MIENIKLKFKKSAAKYTSMLNQLSYKTALHTLEQVRVFIWIGQTVCAIICALQILLPLPNLNFQIINLILWIADCLCLIGACYVNWLLILFTTRRHDLDQEDRVELMWDQLDIMYWQISYSVAIGVAIPCCLTIIPYLQFLRNNPVIKGWTPQMTDSIIGSPIWIRLLIFGIPVFVGLLMHGRIKKYSQDYHDQFDTWLNSFEFQDSKLHDVLANKVKKENDEEVHEPSLVLGKSVLSGDYIVQDPGTRRRNMIATGPIGAGKTSAVFRPQILQDISSFIYYLRNYARLSQREDWDKPFGIQQNLLSGFAVIETTNDLCRTVYEDAIRKGIPKEKIVWFDPDNPNTPSLNMMNGPVENVAQNLTDIMTGLKKSNDDFFSQSERIHLTQHIYLLKEAAIIENKPASFGELIRMYNDVYVVVDKREKLRTYVEILYKKLEKLKNKKEKVAAGEIEGDLNSVEVEYDELKNKYVINSETLGWFDRNIVSPQYKDSVKVQQSGPHKGEPIYEDVTAPDIKGLQNQLTFLAKRVGVRRVLFKDAGNFNLDEWMKNGGIILCNTAQDSLGTQVSEILGQIYSLSLQGATFRRTPNVDPMFPLYQDEFPAYLSLGFTNYAAQARKYNVPITVAAQSPAQLTIKYGPAYLRTIYSVMLTRITFGDMGYDDAVFLSSQFGKHKEVVDSFSEQDIDLAASTSQNRKMVQSRIEEVPNITPEEIMGLENFTMAVRIPGEHNSDLFDKMRVSRISDEDVANQSDNFDLNDPKDKSAYEKMQKLLKHDNPDYDSVDRAIIEEIREGIIKIDEPNLETDAEKIIKFDKSDKIKKFSAKKPKSRAQNEKANISLKEPDNDPFDDIGGSLTDDSVKREPINIKGATELTHEMARKIAERSVFKSPNGGNGRFDNNLKQINDRSVKYKDQIVKRDESKVSEKKIDRIGLKDKTKVNNLKTTKKEALVNFQKNYEKIRNDSNLSQNDKFIELNHFVDQQKVILKPLFNDNLNQIMDKVYKSLDELKESSKSLPTANQLGEVKSNSSKNNDFENDLNYLMSEYDDNIQPNNSSHPERTHNDTDYGNTFQKNEYDDDTPFNDQDPFDNQPGMNDSNNY